MHVLTGRLVAIKSFNKVTNQEKSRRKILHEVNLMKHLNKSGVVKIYETFETPKYLIIIMEYVCGGDLLSYVRKRSKLNEPVAKYIFRQLIEIIIYIHSRNIIHRDIKLDNILIDINNEIKVIKFYLAL